MASSPPPSAAPADTPGVLLTHGARATEEVLFERLDASLPPAADLAGLALPVRVVVPSTSLRLHLAARLARRRGAVAGVVVQTLYAVAREVLERCAGESVPARPGDLAFDVLVRRLARREEALAGGLDFLVDGYGAVAGSVRDLLDAGLEPVLADAADEALLDTLGEASTVFTNRGEVARARALVRVAARVHDALAGLGVARLSALYQRAAHHLAEDPERALPARRVLIHGFADATGLATDLLVALVRRRGAQLLLDAPPDPVAAENDAEGPNLLPPRWQEAFSERLRERLAGLAGETPAAPATPPPPARVELFVAPGVEAEARELAVRVRAVLDAAGAPRPEDVAIVARDVEPLRLALRRHLGALGVPFSGLATGGSLTAAGRRARALLDLLRKGRELPADRWLDAAARLPRDDAGGSHPRGGPFVDLRLAFYASGTGRLRDVARLDLDALLAGRDGLPLPVRRGFSYGEVDAGEEDGGDTDGAASPASADAGEGPPATAARRRTSYARRRHVPRAVLAGAVRAAGELLERLQSWPATAPAGRHLAELRELLCRDLGWSPAEADARPVFDALDALERELPGRSAAERFEISFDELRLLLGRTLKDAGRDPLGGRGGGVQVLSVTEARGRTAEHLFLAGVQRGVFPRTVRPDPLLPDELRRALATVLPDVPRKRAGFDEERYLFAQLVSASPRVTVSWQSHDDEGQPLAPSPLVERLAGAGDGASRVARAPAVWAPRDGEPAPAGPRPAREEAVLAALGGASRSAFAELLAVAVDESRRALADRRAEPSSTLPSLALPAGALAAARRRVLDEVDPDLRDEAGRARAASLGPYLGFLGALREGADDPRRGDPWITHVEGLAACPWQTFLRKVLRLEPTPDPLQALPGADPLLLGSVVHAVLERAAEAAGAVVRQPLAAALAAPPRPLRWPDGEELDGWLVAAATEALREDGVPLPGLARALAERARPLVARARELALRDALRDAAFGGSSGLVGGEEGASGLDGGEGGASGLAGGEEGASGMDGGEGGASGLAGGEGGGGGGVLGAEVEGAVAVADGAGRERRLRFLADRVDAAAGGPRLTDYKTGKPLSTAKRPDTRRDHHLAEVAQGKRLQAVAYALAAAAAQADRGAPAAAEGRYLFLDPSIDEPAAAAFAAGSGDPAFAAAFATAVATLLDAWDAGAFFPRVVDPSGQSEPSRCAWCEVAEACVRGDSAARLRLHRWNAEHAGEASSAGERAHHGVWRLAAASPQSGPEAAGRQADGGAADGNRADGGDEGGDR